MEKLERPSMAETFREYRASADDAIFAAKLDVNGFSASFKHCEQFADYVSQFVTSNRQESDRLNSILSMCLNETLEMAYRYHGDNGALWIEVRQVPPGRAPEGTLLVITSIPADKAAISAYEWCSAQLQRTDAKDAYRDFVRHGFEDTDHKTGLVELVLIYGIELSIHTEPSTDRVTIVMAMRDDAK